MEDVQIYQKSAGADKDSQRGYCQAHPLSAVKARFTESRRRSFRARTAAVGRKSPLGGHGWISSPERRESAISGHSPIADERLLILKAVIQGNCWSGLILAATCPKLIARPLNSVGIFCIG